MKTRKGLSEIGLFLFLIPFFVQMAAFAQNEPVEGQGEKEIYLIQTRDGNEYAGSILTEDELKIVLVTENLGTITLLRSDIIWMRRLDTLTQVKGQFWFANPQATRYFWIPNGYGLKKGESYYQNVWIFFNQVSTGVTDNFSIGAGMVPLFLFAGSQTPVWITPKVSFPVVKDKFNLGAGALAGTIIGSDEGGFGLLYGLSTFGSRDKNMTLGLGWAFAGGEIANSPTISVAGMIRTGPRGYLLTENYFIGAGGETLGIISFGGRRIINRMSIDFGLFLPLIGTVDTFIALPWLGLNIPFGKTSGQ
ncbi:hypothetical protein [Cyclobacterium jeungdonense]|uniref:Uncharacterized protein n=1 Tax=Cyclobacterium jeungdonense TaxID=708087 RepID=A0ABT8C6T5_9BACT|nr:hypothetical protein [Cyclobacterium jeungdonense]MDN3687343.1 hypothetical protein [Cyclobacterium jeungdonense]